MVHTGTPGRPGTVGAPHPEDQVATIDGRPVLTRNDLSERYGLGLSTLEGLYRARGENGHPEAVGKVGRALAWDADAWRTWWTRHRSVQGLITFTDMAAIHDVSGATVASWWADRSDNGHPEPVKRVGNTLYFDEAAYRAWSPPTRAARGTGSWAGHPDDEVTLADAERICGATRGAFGNYPTRPPRHWPDPVRVEPLPSGNVRRYYRAGDILAYDRTRGPHGGGRRPGSTPDRPHPYAGDVRLEIARRALAETPPEHHPALPSQLAADHPDMRTAPGTWHHLLTTAPQAARLTTLGRARPVPGRWVGA